MKSIGFKEWAIVCEALGRGRQSIIIRKGGIAEGRDGFSFRHDEFFLFPTAFHEAADKVRDTALPGLPPNDAEVEIRFFARLDQCRVVTAWDVAESLAPLHILRPEVVRERFDYEKGPGVHVALVRVYRVSPNWRLANEKRFGGCRSWVDLPDAPPGLELDPVLAEAEQDRRRREFLELVDTCHGPVRQA